MEGLYKILKQVGHPFKLKLSKSIKVYPVFYAEKLHKDPDNLLPGQANSALPLLELDNSKLEYKVQQVLAAKLIYRKLHYRIQWKGWDPDPEWHPVSVLKNSLLAL
jgi:hypothetical protein